MKIFYSQASRDDVIRQFRYYLVALDRPDLAVQFKDSVRETAIWLRAWPRIAPIYHSFGFRDGSVRSWAIFGFNNIRVYFRTEPKGIHVLRILHGKQNVRMIMARYLVRG